MNTLTKQLIGAGIGGAIGLFIAQIVIDYIDLRNQQMENFDWLNGTEEDHGDLIVEQTEEYDENADKELLQKGETMSKNKKVKSYTQFFMSEGRPDLAALASKYNEAIEPLTGDEETDKETVLQELEDMEEELEEEVTMEMVDDPDSVDPRIIAMEDYAMDSGLAHVTLNYYSDDILTDEHGRPIDKPENILGEEALVSFGELSGDEDIVYVQNLSRKAMYEVVRKHQPFLKTTSPNVRRRALAKRMTKEEENGEDDA